MDFSKSGTDSIGMELEFLLLDQKSLDLVDGILPLMELCSDNQYLTPEFIQNTVEIASKKCYSIQELDKHFHQVALDLKQNVESLGMCLCAAGTHPFSKQLAHITPKPRYLDMEAAERYRSHTQITFATHVHLGMSNAEDAIRMMRLLKPYLPMLMAISANSPFWHGHNTGYASYRHRVLATTRSYGMPPTFSNWQEFEDFYAISHSAGLYKTDSDIHWDIRPRPKLGSLEIRVMDAQCTITEAVCRAAFIQALAFYLRDTTPKKPTLKKNGPKDINDTLYEYDYWLEKDNLYQASHLGLDALQTNLDPKMKSDQPTLPLRSMFEETFTKVVEFIQNSEDYQETIDLTYLHQLHDQVSQPYGYLKQLGHYEDKLSLKHVTQEMVKALDLSLAP